MECGYEIFIEDLLDGRLRGDREKDFFEHAKVCSTCSEKLRQIDTIDHMTADALMDCTFVSNKKAILERVEHKRVFTSIKHALFSARKVAYAFCIIFVLALSVYYLMPLIGTQISAGGLTVNELTPKNDDGIVYKNQQYGFTLTFPGEWKDKYFVEQDNNILRIHHKKTWEETGQGTLFTLTIFTPKEKWDAEGKELEDTIGLQKIYEDNKIVIGFSRPTDIQNISGDRKSRDEYREMEADVGQIPKTISVTVR